jgi:uncharacterized iron-regulated membrane protein
MPASGRSHTEWLSMRQALAASLAWLRVHLFRLWTALIVVGSCGYLWLYNPEYLTWWKRSVDAIIEASCARLPYPWGDRIEATIGNFGIWVQLTLAILIFRAALGILFIFVRMMRRR